MKFVFKLILLFFLCNTSWSREVIVISYDQREKDSKIIYQELVENFNISPELISILRFQNECPQYTEALFVLCLENNESKINWKKFDNRVNRLAFRSFWNISEQKKEASEEASQYENQYEK